MQQLEITRKEAKKCFNNMSIGSIISVNTIPNITNTNTITWLLSDLNRSGFLTRVARGEYEILKKIPIKRKPPVFTKGRKRKRKNTKDISMIPTILKYEEDGVVIEELRRIYKDLTPIDKQVTMGYLRNMVAYAQKLGVIIKNGHDERFRRAKKGLAPVKYKLVNKHITDNEWDEFTEKFRMFLQKRNKSTNKRKVKEKTVKEKFSCCGTIIDHFNETRDNPNKIYTETFFIKKVKDRLGDKRVKSFVVTGPDYFHHMDSIFTTITDKALVCEIAPDIFDVIYKKANICKYNNSKKVSLLKCDVDDIAPVNCRYTDIDLMKSLKVNYDLISNQLMRQDLLCSSEKEKFFTFTCSRRIQDNFHKTTLPYLQKLLKQHFKADLIALSNGEEVRGNKEVFRSCKLCKAYFNGKGRILDFYLFLYQDKTPMFNSLIIYK